MIKVAVAGGIALYVFGVVMAGAGFTTIVPILVTIPILVLLIGGGNILGGRSHGRTRSVGPPGTSSAPLSSSGGNGLARTEPATGPGAGRPDGGDGATEPG